MDKENLEKLEDDLRDLEEHWNAIGLVRYRIGKILEREKELDRLLGVEAEVTNFENR